METTEETFEEGLSRVVKDLLKVETGVTLKTHNGQQYFCIGNRRIGTSIEKIVEKAKENAFEALLAFAETVDGLRKKIENFSAAVIAALWYFGTSFIPKEEEENWSKAFTV